MAVAYQGHQHYWFHLVLQQTNPSYRLLNLPAVFLVLRFLILSPECIFDCRFKSLYRRNGSDAFCESALLRSLTTLPLFLVLYRHYLCLRLVASPLLGRCWIGDIVLRRWLEFHLRVVSLLHPWSLKREGHPPTILWSLRAGVGRGQAWSL